MAPTVFVGRELEVPGDELPMITAGHPTTTEELNLFLNISESDGRSSLPPMNESRQTSPLPMRSSVEPTTAASEKSAAQSDLDGQLEQAEIAPALESSAPTPKATKKTRTPKATKATKAAKAAAKPPTENAQRRHRRKQMEIYGTAAPRRSSRAPAPVAAPAPARATKVTRKKTADAPKKRGPKTKEPAAKKKKSGSETEAQWEVESILDSQIDADTLEHFYHVKWKGYSSKENTWEPKSNLVNCHAALKQYHQQKGKKKKS